MSSNINLFHVEHSQKFDILIVGAGHAGLEAAWAANQFDDLKVGMITLPGVGIASAPCNPAVGGVGKGQVVREIDAMGGIMGKLADLSAIQYRTLNESKGFAVQSTRVQIDKDHYSAMAEKLVEKSSIQVIRAAVSKITTDNANFSVETSVGDFQSSSVIVTTGTFLKGKMHTGSNVTTGGRVDCDVSNGLEDLFLNVKSLSKRFKTGTPPRLKGESIDLSKMEKQPSDAKSLNFHHSHDPSERYLPQLDCHLTRTNSETLKFIRDNKELSPLFNGQINSVGPRYCPSIEDKAYRYLDKDVHHVFVEPETQKKDTYYPNGVSTSLPVDIQESFIRTIPGLENAEIAVKGYAVEYDVVDTTYLNDTLEYRDISGLYFAGQVCGTSGYEEAAGQGLVAGLNAALRLKNKDKMIFSRDVSYIGVMVDDLTNNLRDEPYRLFTARSENRLSIREDNAIMRMSKYRKSLLLDKSIDTYILSYELEYDLLMSLSNDVDFVIKSSKLSLADSLRKSNVNPVETLQRNLKDSGLSFDYRVIRNVAIDIKYHGYIKRSELESNKLHKLSHKTINFESLLGDMNVSHECRQRIERIRPSNFGQLQRIEGIRPATLAYVAAQCI